MIKNCKLTVLASVLTAFNMVVFSVFMPISAFANQYIEPWQYEDSYNSAVGSSPLIAIIIIGFICLFLYAVEDFRLVGYSAGVVLLILGVFGESNHGLLLISLPLLVASFGGSLNDKRLKKEQAEWFEKKSVQKNGSQELPRTKVDRKSQFLRCAYCNQAIHSISENDKCPNCNQNIIKSINPKNQASIEQEAKKATAAKIERKKTILIQQQQMIAEQEAKDANGAEIARKRNILIQQQQMVAEQEANDAKVAKIERKKNILIQQQKMIEEQEGRRKTSSSDIRKTENKIVDISVWRIQCPDCLSNFIIPENYETDSCSGFNCDVCDFTWTKTDEPTPQVPDRTKADKCSNWEIGLGGSTVILYSKINKKFKISSKPVPSHKAFPKCKFCGQTLNISSEGDKCPKCNQN